MIDHGVPSVLEFNVRFGDPEATVLVPTYDGDWFELLDAVARGDLAGVAARPGGVTKGAALAVVMAAAGYPAKPRTGDRDRGPRRAPAGGRLRHARGDRTRGRRGGRHRGRARPRGRRPRRAARGRGARRVRSRRPHQVGRRAPPPRHRRPRARPHRRGRGTRPRWRLPDAWPTSLPSRRSATTSRSSRRGSRPWSRRRTTSSRPSSAPRSPRPTRTTSCASSSPRATATRSTPAPPRSSRVAATSASSCATTSRASTATTRRSCRRAPRPARAPSRGAASSALVELAPFADRVVLPHERTLSGPKEDRLKLFRATRTNLSPGFMLYRDPARALDAPLATGEPIADFTTADGVHHVLAKVRAPDALRADRRGHREVHAPHRRRAPPLRDGAPLLAGGGRSASGRVAARRAPLLHDVPRERRRPEPRRLSRRTATSTRSRASPSTSCSLAPRARSRSTSLPPSGARPRCSRRCARRRANGTDGAGRRSSRPRADGRAALLTLRGDVDLAAHPTLGRHPAVLRKTDVAVLHSGLLEHVLGITPEAQAAKTNLWYPQDAAAALAELRGGKGHVLFLMNATPVAARARRRRGGRGHAAEEHLLLSEGPRPVSPSTRSTRRARWPSARGARQGLRCPSRAEKVPVTG